MQNLFKERPIQNLKLSELSILVPKDRALLRITGNVDLNESSDDTSLILWSKELNAATNSLKSYKCVVDLSMLDGFNIRDLHAQHDLVQFIGYKQEVDCLTSDYLEYAHFKAVYFRVIRRLTIDKYYAALDVQNSYLNRS